MAAVGGSVLSLKRVRFGPLTLGDLRPAELAPAHPGRDHGAARSRHRRRRLPAPAPCRKPRRCGVRARAQPPAPALPAVHPRRRERPRGSRSPRARARPRRQGVRMTDPRPPAGPAPTGPAPARPAGPPRHRHSTAGQFGQEHHWPPARRAPRLSLFRHGAMYRAVTWAALRRRHAAR